MTTAAFDKLRDDLAALNDRLVDAEYVITEDGDDPRFTKLHQLRDQMVSIVGDIEWELEEGTA